uniref:Uncharacterized protein n=1 Tax=Haemonchus contortus TaxID=6289 RepID=A0A7I4Y4S1_HAECO
MLLEGALKISNLINRLVKIVAMEKSRLILVRSETNCYADNIVFIVERREKLQERQGKWRNERKQAMVINTKFLSSKEVREPISDNLGEAVGRG